jgi:hypothetical protein
MRGLKDRIKAVLKSSRLSGVDFDWENPLNIATTANGRIYTYTVYIPESLVIDKYDRFNLSLVNTRIHRFNDLCEDRIKFAKVTIQPLTYTSDKSSQTVLSACFPQRN